MKQVCLLCERTSPDHNLFCQEHYCPAEMSPTILGQGDLLGDIEIVKALVVQRHSVLYEAMHQKKRVLLKVAHPGQEHKDRLKREAEFLKELTLRNVQESLLPRLLPPYANTKLTDQGDKGAAYGKSMLQGHLLYFCLFQFFEGEPLQDLLKKNPQLWINHVGWMVISLASGVAFLHSKGLLHLGVSTESLLLYFDEEQNVPRVLLFDLGISSTLQEVNQEWFWRYQPIFSKPTYTAPELIDPQSPHAHYYSDSYAVGMVLYELLVGKAGYPYQLSSDQEIIRAIQHGEAPVTMNRIEDVPLIANLAVRAINQTPSARQQNPRDLLKQLLDYFGPVPPPKPSRWPSSRTIWVIVIALLAVAVILMLAINYRTQ